MIIWNMYIFRDLILDEFKQAKGYTFDFVNENLLQIWSCYLYLNHEDMILNEKIVNLIMDILLSNYNLICELIGYYKNDIE